MCWGRAVSAASQGSQDSGPWAAPQESVPQVLPGSDSREGAKTEINMENNEALKRTTQQDQYCHSHEAPREVNFPGQKAEWRWPGAGDAGSGELFSGDRVPVWEDGRVLEMDGAGLHNREKECTELDT